MSTTPPAQRGLTAPATDAIAITPSDTIDLAESPRALYVGTTGDVSLVTLDGTTVTFVGLMGGTFLPVTFRRVNITGTNAADMVGLI